MRSTYANRGQTLEAFVRFANARYRQEGLAFIEKQNTEFIPIRNGRGQIITAKAEHQATFDFMGRYLSHPIAVEAKNTNQDTIRWDAVQPHQARDLDDFTKEPGTIGLVLVSFNLENFFAIPWAFWSEAYDLRVRRGDVKTAARVSAFNEAWTIPQKKSARMEDLSPLWRVSARDNRYGLHYLANAAKYITKNPQNKENDV